MKYHKYDTEKVYEDLHYRPFRCAPLLQLFCLVPSINALSGIGYKGKATTAISNCSSVIQLTSQIFTELLKRQMKLKPQKVGFNYRIKINFTQVKASEI